MEKLREKRTHSFAMGWYSEVKKKTLKDLTEEKRSDVFLRRLVFGHQKYSWVKRSNC